MRALIAGERSGARRVEPEGAVPLMKSVSHGRTEVVD